MSHDRFFLDHGAIHDRMTGQHVGMQAEIEWQSRLLNLLNEMWERITALERAPAVQATADADGVVTALAKEIILTFVTATGGGFYQAGVESVIRKHLRKAV